LDWLLDPLPNLTYRQPESTMKIPFSLDRTGATRVNLMTQWNSWGEDESYWWVVICKNQKFHRHQNMYAGHKIPLGETDAFMPPPSIDFSLTVRCDECGEEFTYDPAELLRFQMGQQPNFKPHPLFL
jgi:hypothetical protein